MRIEFLQSIGVRRSLVFDRVYEPELQFGEREKAALLVQARGTSVWMLVDGELAGESYGLTPRGIKAAIDEEVEDCDPNDRRSLYCYSTTILPAFQGKGLGHVLKAFWLGLAAGHGYHVVIGHATSDAAWAINQRFGAQLVALHEHWYDTPRLARFYRIRL